ncbi:MAG: phytanoyl-CoA dioxygenase family protein, partial [Xanthomonadaceae bacterium]|nr:phytanoyl-CoA dioxygenase family protein [Xanthomonadaceae bacterium]
MSVITRQEYETSRPWIDLDSADVRGYVADQSEDAGFDLECKLTEWHERGIVIFERVVDPALIDALLDDVEYLRKHHRDFDLVAEYRGIRKSVGEFTGQELDSSGVKFESIHAISCAAGRLSLTGTVATFLRHVFRSPPCVLQSLTFYRGSQQPAHIDYPYVRCQTRLAQLAASWIPLEDIHPDSGPLAYYPGSHHPRVSGYFEWGNCSVVMEPDSNRTPMQFAEYLWGRVRDTNTPAEIFLPKKGDVLI